MPSRSNTSGNRSGNSIISRMRSIVRPMPPRSSYETFRTGRSAAVSPAILIFVPVWIRMKPLGTVLSTVKS